MTINLSAQSITGSWKSSVIGLASLLLAAYAGYQGGGGFVAALHDPKVQTFIIMGVLGLIVKDGNVTGGTKGVPSTPAALAAANQAPATGVNAPVAPKP